MISLSDIEQIARIIRMHTELSGHDESFLDDLVTLFKSNPRFDESAFWDMISP